MAARRVFVAMKSILEGVDAYVMMVLLCASVLCVIGERYDSE